MIFFVFPDDSDDLRLLEQARRGDKTALSAIYQRYVEAIYHYIRKRVNDAQTAEDITGSVFEALIDGLAKDKGPRTSLRGWLYQVARHMITDHYRHDEPVNLDEIEQIPGDSQHIDLQVIRALDGERIRGLMQNLSSDQQDVLLLRFDQQLSLRETAAIMGKKINTVKTLQLRALQKLRDQLQNDSL